MSNALVLLDRDAENGKYILGYLTTTDYLRAEKGDFGDKIYQCYIPYTGKVARVPEMSRYFFYNELKKHSVDTVFLTSQDCVNFVSEGNDNINTFKIDKYCFVKQF